MISKSDFLTKMRGVNPSITGEEPDFGSYDDAAEAAAKALAAMPGIGFASIRKRFNAFLAVCRHLDAMTEQGEIDSGGAQLAVLILRLSNKPFLKAAVAFDINGPKLGIVDRVELPETAREYLAGINTYG